MGLAFTNICTVFGHRKLYSVSNVKKHICLKLKIICRIVVIKGKSHFGMIMFFPDCVNISSYSLTFSIKDLRCKFNYGRLDLDLLLAYKEVIVTSLTLQLTLISGG